MSIRRSFWSLLVVTLAVFAGCSSGGSNVSNDGDDGAGQAVADRIMALHREGSNGEPVALADLTDFSWDAVHVFPEGTPKALVNDTVGAAVFEAGEGQLQQRGTFLVFTEDSEIRAQVWVAPLEISASELTYGPDAELETYTPPPGPFGLRFVR